MDELTSSGRRSRIPLPTVLAGAGAVWLVLHASGLLGDAAAITFPALGLVAVAGTVYGVVRWRPQPRWPWLLLLSAFLVFLVSGAVRDGLPTLGDLSADRSLAPDLIALPGYVLVGVALLGLARGRHIRAGQLDTTLDATVAALAAFTVAWAFLIMPTLANQDVRPALRIVLVSYPVLSVFLTAIGVRLVFSGGGTNPLAYRLVLAALVALLVGDIVFMLEDLGLMTVPTRLVELPYAIAFGTIAVAVVHPSIRDVGAPVPASALLPRSGRAALVAVGICVPAIVALSVRDASTLDRVALGSIVVALTGVVSWRMYRALRAHASVESNLLHRLTHDALTGLPNRTEVHDHLTDLLREPVGPAHQTAVVLLDLDRFKLVNDTFGHGLGDELLLAVARRLVATTRSVDRVARVGGDEFVVVIEDATGLDAVREIAERTRLSLAVPFEVRGVEIPVRASVGVAIGTAGVDDAETLLRDADTAMYQAKDAGGDLVAVFDATVRARLTRRLAVERTLRSALDRGELTLAYQPIIDLREGCVVGIEALARWNSPTLGSVPPDEFIEIAEDTGIIDRIGAWFLDEACAELAALRAWSPHAERLTMSVNVSVRQLRDESLLDHVARSLLRNALPGAALHLELTESMVMENVDRMTDALGALRNAGVQVVIDDFGTGYSSLAYLKQLPVDQVKVDRTFVTGLERDSADASLVSAVVAIAGALDIPVVAEGVETAADEQVLRDLGCAKAQGYHYSTPVPATELPDVLRRLGLPGEPHLQVVPNPA